MAAFHVDDDEYDDELDYDFDPLLAQQLQELIESNEKIMAENLLLENYLRRVAPALLTADEDDEGRGLKARKSRLRKEQKQQTLTSEQKFEIATRELEELRDEIETTEERSELALDNLKAITEETDICTAEIKKDAYEFRRDIVHGAKNKRTGKVSSEKVIRYFEEKLRAKDANFQRLRLKNKALTTQISKLNSQLQQKEEMGEVVRAVDFEKYKIENQQYQEAIERRNEDLLALKRTAGNTVQVLNAFKKKLADLTAEQALIRKEYSAREDNLRKLQDEVVRVQDEETKASSLNRKLKKQQEEFVVPDVMAYVDLKAEMHDLTKKIDDWQRKVEIAQVNLRIEKGKARQAARGGRVAPGRRR